MNTLHLKYAVEIEKTGSISRAAANLFMGQPTLSKTIKELESGLGYEIFTRTPKGVSPTPKGEAFLTHAKAILSQMEMIETISISDDRKNTQILNVVAPRASYVASAFTDFVKALDQSGQICVNYKETNAMRTINKISVGEYGIGILRFQTEYEGYFSDYLNRKNFVMEPLLEFQTNALMHQSHPLAKKKKLGYSDFTGFIELIHGDNFVPYLAEPAPLSGKQICIYERASQFDLLQKLPGAYIQSAPMPKAMLEQFDLCERACEFPNGHHKDMLVFMKDHTFTPLEKDFIRHLKDVVRDLSEEQSGFAATAP